MEQVTLLRDTLRSHLNWHGARLTFLAMFLIALLQVRTVNFSDLAVAFCSRAQSESSYKRLQRFFRDYELDESALIQMVVSLLKIPEPWVLSVDRTEWHFGSCVFNILVLGVVHQGVAIPLVWTMLEKPGNSNTLERMQLLSRFLERFGYIEIDYLTADREFVGQEWFSYLKAVPPTPIRIRIRENHCLFDGRRSLSAKTLFAHLQPSQQQVLRKQRRLWGHWLYVAAMRLEDGNLLIVVTQFKPKRAIADYAKRWSIETLFGMFKSRGFCLEATHLRESQRVSKLLALLTVALGWALSSGQWLHQAKPIPIKSHGRRAKSLFRYGLDYLRSILLNLNWRVEDFSEAVQFLSCT
ncbi:IS4 family transposase [Sphaerothrix gracilis]|uniref:IS4 family transposase n=1 Tax=Sphaerothrix gracilis TaxID=3151835 RepID=UPI0031FC2514